MKFLMIQDFAVRERALVNPTMALIAFPGGVGTNWEVFQKISYVQTKKQPDALILLVGQKDYWSELLNYGQKMAEVGTVSPQNLNIPIFEEDPIKAAQMTHEYVQAKGQSEEAAAALLKKWRAEVDHTMVSAKP